MDRDERPMATSMEKMSKLRPVFAKDGTVTAGNASGINDGAAAVLLMSEEKARQLELEPLLTIDSFASAGLDPAYMGLGPVPAIRRALRQIVSLMHQMKRSGCVTGLISMCIGGGMGMAMVVTRG